MENMTTPAVHHNDTKWFIIMSLVIYSLVFVLGTLGNGVVIWATGFRMKKTINTVLFLNLAVADFLVTAVLPLKITETVWGLGYSWPLAKDVVFYMNMYASIYTLVLISVDRCVRLVYPFWARTHRTVRNASWVSLGVWVLALALSIPEFISKEYFGVSDNVTVVVCYEYCFEYKYTYTTIGITTNFLAGFVVPFSIITSCYSVIINRYKNRPMLVGQSGRAFKIIAAVIAAFFLCWAPFHIIWLILMFEATGLIEPSATLARVLTFGVPITVTLALVNSCLNPLLYMYNGTHVPTAHTPRPRGRPWCVCCWNVFQVLEVLENDFEEEEEINNTPTDPDVTEETPLLRDRGYSIGPPGTQDPSP